jgi:hypothetical protein
MEENADMDEGIEVRIFFEMPEDKRVSEPHIEGSHSRRFPLMPIVGQTLVFGKRTGEISVFQVIETGFFVWDEGATAWVLVRAVAGEHRVPSGFYDPIAGGF